MFSRFWQGLLWGSVLGTVLGAVMGPMIKPRKKPLTERSINAVRAGTRELMREARHVRKRLLKKVH